MIKDFGNCGHKGKLARIEQAWESAKLNRCGIIFIQDPLVYGNNNVVRFDNIQRLYITYNHDTLAIVSDTEVKALLSWWDITKVSVVW